MAMRWFKLGGLEIGARIGVSFALILLLVLVVGVTGLLQMRHMAENADELRTADFAKLDIAQKAVALSSRNHRMTLQLFLLSDQPAIDALLEERAQNSKDISELLAQIASRSTSDAELALLDVIRGARAPYVASYQRAVKQRLAGHEVEARAAIIRETIPLLLRYHDAWSRLVDLEQQRIDARLLDSLQRYRRSRGALIAAILLVIVAAAAIAVAVTRQVSGSYAELSAAAEQLAGGNLDVTIDIRSEGDVLGRSLRTLRNQLEGALAEVGSSANTLRQTSDEILRSAFSLAAGVDAQVTSIDQTAEGLREIEASIGSTALNSESMRYRAETAVRSAGEARVAVTEALSAGEAILMQIALLDDIAYHTRLLALNAAIEAARLASRGQGFAVIAAEVRKLSERSQKAAKQATAWSKSSVAVAARCQASLADVMRTTTETAALVQEVAAASAEQAQGIAGVARSLQRMESVTQANAVASRTLTATAEQMQLDAESLQQIVAFFHYSGRSAPEPLPLRDTAAETTA